MVLAISPSSVADIAIAILLDFGQDHSRSSVVVSDNIKSQMEAMVEEYAIRVIPQVEVEAQRDKSEDYDIEHDR